MRKSPKQLRFWYFRTLTKRYKIFSSEGRGFLSKTKGFRWEVTAFGRRADDRKDEHMSFVGRKEKIHEEFQTNFMK